MGVLCEMFLRVLVEFWLEGNSVLQPGICKQVRPTVVYWLGWTVEFAREKIPRVQHLWVCFAERSFFARRKGVINVISWCVFDARTLQVAIWCSTICIQSFNVHVCKSTELAQARERVGVFFLVKHVY